MTVARVDAAAVIARHHEGATVDELLVEFRTTVPVLEAILGKRLVRSTTPALVASAAPTQPGDNGGTAHEGTEEEARTYCEQRGIPFAWFSNLRHLAERPTRKKWITSPKQGGRPSLSPQYVARIRELWAQGEKARSIVARLDVSIATVLKYVRGVPRKSKSEPQRRTRSPSSPVRRGAAAEARAAMKWRETMRALRAEGASLREIAKAVGCSHAAVNYHVKDVKKGEHHRG